MKARTCDRTHTSTQERDVVNYAKAIKRDFDREARAVGLSHVSIAAHGRRGVVTPAFVRLYLAVQRLEDAEARERTRAGVVAR